jgi:hypothetical protein
MSDASVSTTRGDRWSIVTTAAFSISVFRFSKSFLTVSGRGKSLLWFREWILDQVRKMQLLSHCQRAF